MAEVPLAAFASTDRLSCSKPSPAAGRRGGIGRPVEYRRLGRIVMEGPAADSRPRSSADTDYSRHRRRSSPRRVRPTRSASSTARRAMTGFADARLHRPRATRATWPRPAPPTSPARGLYERHRSATGHRLGRIHRGRRRLLLDQPALQRPSRRSSSPAYRGPSGPTRPLPRGNRIIDVVTGALAATTGLRPRRQGRRRLRSSPRPGQRPGGDARSPGQQPGLGNGDDDALRGGVADRRDPHRRPIGRRHHLVRDDDFEVPSRPGSAPAEDDGTSPPTSSVPHRRNAPATGPICEF